MRRAFFVTVVVLLGGGAGWAQTALEPAASADQYGVAEERVPAPEPSWGTSSSLVATVASFECDTVYDSIGWSSIAGTLRRFTTSPHTFMCGVHLPAGASLQEIELQGCDTSTTSEVQVMLGRATDDGYSVAIGQLNTGVAAALGCSWWSQSLAFPYYTVNNYNDTYFLQVNTLAGDASTSFVSARVYYRLQVSPAPASATFGDVPTTSAYFKYVEALAAAGVVGGCGGGNYCPGTPVTRGQMAVFLASALGMHWAH